MWWCNAAHAGGFNHGDDHAAEVVTAGAQWRAHHGLLNSGDTEIEVPVGAHVEFKDVATWLTPENQTVDVEIADGHSHRHIPPSGRYR